MPSVFQASLLLLISRIHTDVHNIPALHVFCCCFVITRHDGECMARWKCFRSLFCQFWSKRLAANIVTSWLREHLFVRSFGRSVVRSCICSFEFGSVFRYYNLFGVFDKYKWMMFYTKTKQSIYFSPFFFRSILLAISVLFLKKNTTYTICITWFK